MQYYVIGTDGGKYGPADIQTLNAWIAEGRVTSQTMLEDVATGQQLMATSVPGLSWGVRPETNYSSPPGPNQYPRGPQYMGGVIPGNSELTTAWVMLAVGLTCCPFIANIIGLIYANKAIALGNNGGTAARIVHIVFLTLNSLGILFYVGVIIYALSNPSSSSSFR